VKSVRERCDQRPWAELVRAAVRSYGVTALLLSMCLSAVFTASALAAAGFEAEETPATVSDQIVREIQQIRRLRYAGELERAIRSADTALGRDMAPLDQAVLFIERASLNKLMGRFRASAQDLNAAIALEALPSPQHEQLYVGVAEMRAADQDIAGAVAAYEAGFNAGARATPNDVLLIGLVYMLAADDAQDKDEQAALLAQGVEFAEFAYRNDDPRTRATFQLMAAYGARLGRHDEVRTVIAAWLEAFPESDAAQSSLEALGALPLSCSSGDEPGPERLSACAIRLEAPSLASVHPGMQRPVYRVPPVYPTRAAERGIEGACTVLFDVTPEGEPTNLRPIECDAIFERATINAIRAWRYTPARENGEPVWRRDVETMLEFQLD